MNKACHASMPQRRHVVARRRRRKTRRSGHDALQAGTFSPPLPRRSAIMRAAIYSFLPCRSPIMSLEYCQIAAEPRPHMEAVVRAPQVRFTLLTSRLIRMEYSPTEEFEDRASQAFWYRCQPVPEFTVTEERGGDGDRDPTPAAALCPVGPRVYAREPVDPCQSDGQHVALWRAYLEVGRPEGDGAHAGRDERLCGAGVGADGAQRVGDCGRLTVAGL